MSPYSAVDPLLVHEVDDELQLVQALEVRRLRLVPGLDEGVEARLDQRRHATAEHRLLAEEVGLGLLVERRVEDAGPGRAEGVGVREGEVVRLAAGILLDGDQRRDATALGVGPTDEVAGALRGDHRHVDAGGRDDLAIADVEAVGEEEGVALLQVRGDLGVVDGLLLGVRQEDHDDVGLRRRAGDRQHAQPGLLGLLLRTGPLPQADADVDAGLGEVECVGVPLGAVAQDGDLSALDQPRVGVGLVVQRGHGVSIVSRSALSRLRRRRRVPVGRTGAPA
jgi:hypothetical protein